MSNNSNNLEREEKQSKETIKNQRTKILVFLANWASETQQIHSPAEMEEMLETLMRVYLISDWANDKEERENVLLLFDQLDKLFEGMGEFENEDYKLIDRWLLKQIA